MKVIAWLPEEIWITKVANSEPHFVEPVTYSETNLTVSYNNTLGEHSDCDYYKQTEL